MYTISKLIPILYVMSFACSASGQYQYDQGRMNSYGGGGGEHEDDGLNDRPKVQLGLRVKIPSMKFELPRFSLPKITVSAKIRQPDRPRVINLPEINLDTTSSKTSNHGSGENGRYQQNKGYADSGYQQGNYYDDGYQNNNQKEQTFSFSTHEADAPGSAYGSGSKYQSNNNNYNNYGTMSQQQMKQAVYSSSTNIQPSYQLANHQVNYATNENLRYPQTHHYDSSRHTDLGFDSPIYVQPNNRQEPIEAYGRYPIRAMAFHPTTDGSSFRVPHEEQAVVVANKFRLSHN